MWWCITGSKIYRINEKYNIFTAFELHYSLMLEKKNENFNYWIVKMYTFIAQVLPKLYKEKANKAPLFETKVSFTCEEDSN